MEMASIKTGSFLDKKGHAPVPFKKPPALSYYRPARRLQRLQMNGNKL
jgi:hypothetical protein